MPNSVTAGRASPRLASLVHRRSCLITPSLASHRRPCLLAPSQPPPPPAAPPCAVPAYATTGRASTRRAGLRALLPPLPHWENAVVCHTSPASRPWSSVPPLTVAVAPSPALPAVAAPPGCCPLSLRALPLPEQPLPATTAIPTATVAPSPTASHSPPATDASLPLPTPTLSLLRRLWPDPLLEAPDPATGWLDPSTVTPDPRHPPPPLKS